MLTLDSPRQAAAYRVLTLDSPRQAAACWIDTAEHYLLTADDTKYTRGTSGAMAGTL